MTNQSSQFPRFYVTATSICPYLEGKMERKVFTELKENNPGGLHESLARIGFRRSQDIAYRPSCDDCTECKSVRIPVVSFRPSRTQRRLIKVNDDLIVKKVPNEATQEQYNLLRKYLAKRHTGGGMSNMAFEEYIGMVETSPVKSCLFEYRLPAVDDEKNGKLVAVTLTDIMRNSLSMVYSFFDITQNHNKRSLGTYIILDHVARARLLEFKHVYLGYWVENSPKMSYKSNFQPLEILQPEGWYLTERS